LLAAGKRAKIKKIIIPQRHFGGFSMTSRIPALLCACICTTLPSAHAVDFEINENTNFSIFGEFNFLYLADEVRLVADPDGSLEPEDEDEDPSVSGDEVFRGVDELIDNGSNIGVAGDFTLENGLMAYFLAEWDFRADEDVEDEGGLFATGDSYIGLTGNFGTVQLGNWDGIYDEAILEVLDNFEYEGVTEYTFTADAGDLLSYQSRDFEGFSFGIQTSIKGDGAGIDNDPDPASTDPYPADSIYPLLLAASYETDLFSVRLGYDDRQLVHADAEPQIGLAATLDLEPFSFGVKFETIGESFNNADDGVELVGLIGTFDYEVGEVSLAVQEITFDTEVPNPVIDFDTDTSDLRQDRTEILLHANYRLGDNVLFYFETAAYDATEDLGDYTGLGTILEF
jgi:predicted porin